MSDVTTRVVIEAWLRHEADAADSHGTNPAGSAAATVIRGLADQVRADTSLPGLLDDARRRSLASIGRTGEFAELIGRIPEVPAD